LAATYSIVIPAYNESARIRATLDKVLAHIGERGWNAEVLIVNDGSSDDTAQIVQQYASQHPALRLLENPGNRGKGYSVRNGMLHASGEWMLFSDADLSSPIEEADKLIAALADGADVVMGSRWLRKELQTQPQPLYRQFYGRIFNVALRIILGLHYRDTQCGFKAFTRQSTDLIFPLQHIERWGFDPELLFLARKFGLKVEEVPVKWAHREGTRLNPLRDGLRMFLEILKIRWYSLTGKYDARSPSTVATS
jgi:glycosyltransferase involved in cell wall biosynthesis